MPVHFPRSRWLLVAWSATVVALFVLLAPHLSVAAAREAARALIDDLGSIGTAWTGFEAPTRLVLVVVLGTLWTYACWFSGHRVLRAVAAGPTAGLDPLGISVLELATGVSAAIVAMSAAGFAGLLRPSLAWGLLGVALAGRHGRFVGEIRARLLALRGELRGGGLLLACLGVSGALSLLQCLAPVTAQDALVYHLAVPAEYVRAGGIVEVPGSFFAKFPQNVEMLFTWGLLVGPDSLPGFLHWILGVASIAAVGWLARAIRPGASGLLAATAFGTIPTVALIGGWPYVDLGVVFFTAVSTACFLEWLGARRTAWLVLAAAFAGVAAGSKYTAGFQGILVVVGVVAACRGARPSVRWGSAVLAAGVVGWFASPWLIRNLLETGNPVYPFAFGVFGGKDWDPQRALVLSMFLSQWGRPEGLLDLALLPWRLTMDAAFFVESRFDGVIGPAFLIGAPLLVAGLRLSRRYVVVAVFTVGWSLFWIATTHQVRFLLPALALASALLGAAVPTLDLSPPSRAGVAWALRASFVLNLLVTLAYSAGHCTLPVVLGLERERDYLRRELPGGDYPVFEHIERALPETSRILFAGLGNPGFLCKRPYRSDAIFENRTLRELLERSSDERSLLDRFRERGFTHLLFRADLVLGPKSDLTPGEQTRLVAFLEANGRLVAGASGTVLFEVGDGIGPRGAPAAAAARAEAGS